ncbi:hypothetical protein CROQUDRAFT_136776 [Cronartium quercuum f. sp. fusiforme G11]|uniref:Secreted protein n=1 Tax=Cronartium quercuum f. sp. fusiforme G11 TaxID=708437 RepID=A0A9P6N9P0_9BASI|nr:hypothetical protein CROQUDRAFT_136776 [Cronartium quercuum f. sp. fusiforme G11]
MIWKLIIFDLIFFASSILLMRESMSHCLRVERASPPMVIWHMFIKLSGPWPQFYFLEGCWVGVGAGPCCSGLTGACLDAVKPALVLGVMPRVWITMSSWHCRPTSLVLRALGTLKVNELEEAVEEVL